VEKKTTMPILSDVQDVGALNPIGFVA